MTVMKRSHIGFAALLSLLLVNVTVSAADESNAWDGAQQVESGAKQIGRGVEDAPTTVVAGTTAGDETEAVGKAAEAQATRAWRKAQNEIVSFGHSVKNLFTKLFDN